MNTDTKTKHSLGLWGATSVGVGAIVGGGILALAGVAFSTTGPGAIAAFTLNGVIAFLTALSFAEMSSRFPQSGGSYVFAKKVLSVRAAFAVGWVVWSASIAAAALYALGFASYAVFTASRLWELFGDPPIWLARRGTITLLAVGAAGLYSFGLARTTVGGGRWETAGKMVLFVIVIVGGLWALTGRSLGSVRENLSPFFPGGGPGLLLAMGNTFIALQGFDLISSVGGEIKDPGRTIPRAMMLSLGLALGIYLPLLFIMATVGVPAAQSIMTLGSEHPETFVAVAAQHFMGPVGLWLVSVAAILSMLSALHANLFAASRVAVAMALDRTLPQQLGALHQSRETPINAILASVVALIVILVLIPDVAAAGATASLIFLLSFGLAHWTAILARRRGGGYPAPFRAPWFPLFPVVGGVSCLALAVFQALAVPTAGMVIGTWLTVGLILYGLRFARRARVRDVSAEVGDPQVTVLRGRNPLVLVPIANPKSAAPLVEVANTLSPSGVGRVLLLTVVAVDGDWRSDKNPQQLTDAQDVLRESLAASLSHGLTPEALTTLATEPWREIVRVARIHRCESLLLGVGKLQQSFSDPHFEDIMGHVDCDVVSLRAPADWRLSSVKRVLVPVGGRGRHDELRARLLSNLCRTGLREITYLRALAEDVSERTRRAAELELARFAQDEIPGSFEIAVVQESRAEKAIVQMASECDLVVLGTQRLSRRQKIFGRLVLDVLRETPCAVILISRRG